MRLNDLRPFVLCAALFVGCTPADPEGLWCEGGVNRGGGSNGGECLDISKGSPDGDPATIAKAVWVSDYTKSYSMRRAGKSMYTLYDKGERAGTIERDGRWLHVKFGNDGKRYSVRSDMPGPFM